MSMNLIWEAEQAEDTRLTQEGQALLAWIHENRTQLYWAAFCGQGHVLQTPYLMACWMPSTVSWLDF